MAIEMEALQISTNRPFNERTLRLRRSADITRRLGTSMIERPPNAGTAPKNPQRLLENDEKLIYEAAGIKEITTSPPAKQVQPKPKKSA